MKNQISENLKHLIKLHDGISILELSKRTHIPQPTLHHILSGETKNPRKQALEALSKFFSISIDQLTGKNSLPTIPDILKKNLKISTVPVITWDMLNQWPKNKAPEYLQEIILDRPVNLNSFALIMQDSTMEPLFPEKSILIFELGKRPKDRDFAIARLSKKNVIIFNRLFIDDLEFYIKQEQQGGNAQLLKLNLLHDNILATLIEVRLQF